MQNYNSCFGDLLDLHGDCDDIEDSGGGGDLLGGVDAVPPVQQSYQDIKAPQSSILLRSCGDNPLTTLFLEVSTQTSGISIYLTGVPGHRAVILSWAGRAAEWRH